MKILFISNALPFPARNGLELPIEKLARHFSRSHVLDFLVVGSSAAAHEDFTRRLPSVPRAVRKTLFLQVRRPGAFKSLAAELFGRRPMFDVRGDFNLDVLESILDETYDFIWVSPLGCLGLAEELARRGRPLEGRIVVGLNDATYGNYAAGWRYLFRRPDLREWHRMLNALRTPWLFVLERKLLRNAFAVHVQTPLEQRRVERLFRFTNDRPALICKQNGSREVEAGARPVSRKGKVVIFMTHLSGGRREECRWFLKKVWPRVLEDHPDAELWLVGSPPGADDSFARRLPRGVRVLGFVDDLDQVLRQGTLAVMPSLLASGWINRISDYLRAGLPVVACPEPLSTAPGLVPGVHAEAARSPGEFASKVKAILENPESFQAIARAGQELAMGFPDWDETVRFIEGRLIALKRADEN